MKHRIISTDRKTKETEITLTLELPKSGENRIEIKGAPFFEHLINSMAFHGNIGLILQAEGDTEIDQHHLIEDIGLVLGDGFFQMAEARAPLVRFGHAVIPMDDSLAEAAFDICGRSYLHFDFTFPQEYVGDFPVCLIEEFWFAFASRCKANVHLQGRYGFNSHHLAEALFKAAGKGLEQAYASAPGTEDRSTKGTLSD